MKSKSTKNAARTRQAILEAGVRGFSQRGYDGIGVREIAGNAGVTAMLVNRYFGSKEQLFVACVESAFGAAPFALGGGATLTEQVAEHMVKDARAGGTGETAMQILIRSASNQSAAEILRAAVVQRFADPLAAALGGEERALRAALLLSVLAGFQLMRQVLKLPALTHAAPRSLTQRLEGILGAATAEKYGAAKERDRG
ncbi:MAG TPA: TetR family transcriptional regulator [Polyangia bacterium]